MFIKNSTCTFIILTLVENSERIFLNISIGRSVSKLDFMTLV